MGQRLKKKDSPTSLAFTDNGVSCLLQLVKEYAFMVDDFTNVVSCSTNGKDQLNIMKQIIPKLKQNDVACDQNCISILCDMFILCVSRHPMRRTLTSVLQSMSSEEASKPIIVSTMSSKVVEIFKNIDQSVIRENIEMISALMENFSLGTEVIQTVCCEVFQYMELSLEKCIILVRQASNPVHQTKLMQDILATLKTLIAVLQKYEFLNKESVNVVNILGNSTVKRCIERFLEKSVSLAHDNFFILDCRSAAAMLFPAIASLLPDEELHNTVDTLTCLFENSAESSKVFPESSNVLSSMVREYLHTYFRQGISETALLVLLNAVLVKLPGEIFRKLKDRDCCFRETIFVQKLINISNCTTDKNTLVLTFKAMTVWVLNAQKGVSGTDQLFNENLINVVVLKLLPHLVIFMDHQVDSVRHQVNVTVKDCLLILSETGNEEKIKKFSSEFIAGDMKSRGKLNILTHIVNFIPAENILKIRPTFARDVLCLLADVDLSSHSCDLYQVSAHKHLNELQFKSKDDLRHWFSYWVEQIYEPLSSGSKETKTNIVEYIIPALLKMCPFAILELCQAAKTDCKLIQVRTLVVFLKALRSMKNISKNDSSVSFYALCNDSNNMWKGLVSEKDMRKCLTHIDDQVRLDASSLICNSAKTTDMVDNNDIELVKKFLKYNMASDNPSFRHQVVTNLKKMILRMFAHAFQIIKNGSVHPGNVESSEVIDRYSSFFHWLVVHIFSNLQPDAPYCQKTMSLEILLLIAMIFSENGESVLLGNVQFTVSEKKQFTEILVESFDDTYDPNRLIVYQIFTFKPLFCTTLEADRKKEIFEEALQRTCSPQPDVSSISAYLMNFAISVFEPGDLSELMTNAAVLFKSLCMLDSYDYFKESDSNILSALDVSMRILKYQLSVMKKSLINASQNAPLYGILYCIRMVFQLQSGAELSSLAMKHEQSFSLFLTDLFLFCIEIVDLVAHFVSSDAPEGSLCDASLAEVFEQLHLHEIQNNNIEVQAQIARMLLVCCWRSMKEVSLLLGILVSNFSSNDSLISKSILLKIWDMFSSILLRSKHAGAYELASVGFIKLCSVFWASVDVELQLIPREAVNSLIAELLSPDAFDNAQVTRRSAGLPFYLKALCNTEPAIKANQSFKYLMSSLINLCKNHMNQHDINKLVIALNILRAFFKDSKLAEDVYPYISDGVIIAVTGFSSAIWAVRNSCTLLFSAMMQRIFGVKKFRMTGRGFFSRFPALYSFLMEQAKVMSRQQVNDAIALHPSVFPVLLLLSHLYPSTVEGGDSVMKLSAFIPYVQSCASSAVYKTRTMAAKALVPLTSSSEAKDIMLQILAELQSINLHLVNQNMVHGHMLILKSLLENSLAQNNANLLDVLQLVHESSEISLSNKICFTSRAVYLDILTLTLRSCESVPNRHAIEEVLRDVLKSCTGHIKENIGYTIFMRSAMSYICAIAKDTDLAAIAEGLNVGHSIANTMDLLLLLLRSYSLEVRTGTLSLINSYCDSQQVMNDELTKTFFNIVHDWDASSRGYSQIIKTLANILCNTCMFPGESLVKLWQKWKTDRIFIDNISDELRVSILKLLSVYLSHEMEIGESNLTFYEEIWSFIESSSDPDQCYESRESVTEILKVQSKHKDWNFDAIKCCVYLLKDADSDIRNKAAANLFAVLRETEDDFFIPQPSVMLEMLFDEVLNLKMLEDPNKCIELLHTMATNCASVSANGKAASVAKANGMTAANRLLTNEVTRIDPTTNEMTPNRVTGLCGNGSSAKQNDVLKRFVVFEEGKSNPYYDAHEISKLSWHLIQKCCNLQDLPERERKMADEMKMKIL